MGAEDKASNKIDDLGGKAKEALGKVTGDKDDVQALLGYQPGGDDAAPMPGVVSWEPAWARLNTRQRCASCARHRVPNNDVNELIVSGLLAAA